MSQKPAIPKGTRDFGLVQMRRRNYIFDTIKSVYRRHGFQAIETPAMENLNTLMGKYGEEGDKLIFKILNSGDYLKKVDPQIFDELIKQSEEGPNLVYKKLTPKVSEKALRYDLTVPFARFVVQHRHEITFPFKRYQIQPVWRADRPQKGRYREFYQCDADVIGSNSLLNEVELIQMIKEVFVDLKVNVAVKLNNRKILAGIAESIGQADKIIDITVAIDKLDKIGIENVNKELISKGLTNDQVDQLQPTLNLSGSSTDKLEKLKEILAGSPIGLAGIVEMEEVLQHCNNLGLNTIVELDLTLARGLNYYTGAIIEVKALDVQIGSICGGGRYDDLTGIFGLKDVSGVGISFGADRIYDVLDQLEAFPEHAQMGTQILFTNFGPEEIAKCLPIAADLRAIGFAVEIYPDSAKMKKQLSYANNHSIPFVVLAGKDEFEKNEVTVKLMEKGDQKSIPLQDILTFFQTTN